MSNKNRKTQAPKVVEPVVTPAATEPEVTTPEPEQTLVPYQVSEPMVEERNYNFSTDEMEKLRFTDNQGNIFKMQPAFQRGKFDYIQVHQVNTDDPKPTPEPEPALDPEDENVVPIE
jgi:hypothetical protein